MPEDVQFLSPGQMFGAYEVVRELGRGGMGAVYLVRDGDGDEYAVKVLFPAAALFVVMLLTVLIGEGLRDAFDPRQKSKLE